ncbi:ephrin-A1 isoform X1 [Ovis aries]|uniref:Ephrin-A1 n=1 Tax=Capra hircus TaxID=9925 RepID=A0A8C2S7U1_CAPHI|nr:ephrin-A1 isoform X1 [Ovis aries]
MEFLWASLLGLCCSLAAANRHTVFWNSSNPKFWNEDYTVHVRIDDYLDIICPHYEDNSVPDAAMEQYTLYLVEHEQYQLCQPQPKDPARWFCKNPKAKHGPEKLSEKFHRFTGFTLSKDFKEGHNYYYISKPIHNQEDRCLRLKVMIAGKISECQGPVGLLSPSYPGPGRKIWDGWEIPLPSPANTPTPLLPACTKSPDLRPPLSFSSQPSGPCQCTREETSSR